MYHVLTTGITALLLYLISYSLYRIGYCSLQFHKKLWNIILATVFLVTALAGIFLALQVNYKWNIPFVKTILRFHVEFGIGMAFTGIFHFIWHLPYFKRIATSDNKNEIVPEDHVKLSPGLLRSNLFIIGFVSTSVQLLLIREMMNIAGGYEMIAGVFLCSWLLISAIGSAIAGKTGFIKIKTLNLVFSLSPLISVILLLLFSRLLLNTGETPSFLISVVFTLIVLLPFCLVSGFTFIKMISIANRDADFFPGKSFSVETTGGIVSGLLIAILTSGLLNTYQLILIIIIAANTYVLTTWYISSHKIKATQLVISTFLLILVVIFNPDIFFRQILLPGIRITGTKDSPYGNLTTGIYKGENSKFYNQRLLSYNNDVIEREENIHYAMLQSNSTERVMLISGSRKSYLPEIMKYKVNNIISVERDPALTKHEIRSDEIIPANLSIVNEDPFRYIRQNTIKNDVIISLAAPPSTLLLNRFYTLEFFEEIKRNLTDYGVFMCSPGIYDNYMNNESVKLYSSIYNSLSRVFKNVLPIAGNKLYFIASDKELSYSICTLYETKKIINSYVNSDFLSDDLIKSKSSEISSLMDLNVKPNKLTHPLACMYFQSYTLTRSMNEKTPSIILLLVLFATPVIAIKRRNLLMYFTASALAGFEIILLMILQLTIGNMYQLTGLILAGIMGGLALGSNLDFNFFGIFSMKIKGLMLIIFYLISGLALNSFLTIDGTLPAIGLLLISSFLPSFVTGNIFRDLTIKNKQIYESSATYTADLTGSAFGLIAVSAIIVPAFGIKGAIFLLSALIFTGFLFGTVSNK